MSSVIPGHIYEILRCTLAKTKKIKEVPWQSKFNPLKFKIFKRSKP